MTIDIERDYKGNPLKTIDNFLRIISEDENANLIVRTGGCDMAMLRYYIEKTYGLYHKGKLNCALDIYEHKDQLFDL